MGNNIFENSDICSKCGGFCCKKCGCDYSADDFSSLKIDYLQKKIEEGNISIVSYQCLKRVNGKLFNTPFLYLRARNSYRGIVDLLSLKTRCASLTDKGCSYSLEERPSGGINLIPVENGGCYPMIDQFEIVKTWESSQRVLSRLVKRFTGMSVDERLREDVYQLFCDLFEQNFEGVTSREIEDVLNMVPMLQEVYPNQYDMAKLKFSKPHVLERKRVLSESGR